MFLFLLRLLLLPSMFVFLSFLNEDVLSILYLYFCLPISLIINEQLVVLLVKYVSKALSVCLSIESKTGCDCFSGAVLFFEGVYYYSVCFPDHIIILMFSSTSPHQLHFERDTLSTKLEAVG